jgi:hypothetical protein
MNYVKMLVPLMASLGLISFFIGSYMKIVNVKHLLNAPPAGWWRASIAFLGDWNALRLNRHPGHSS